jgi:hypothetical protein
MAPAATAPLARQHPHAVSVTVTGGSETGAMDSSSIASADLKTAIEQAITQSKLFTAVAPGGTPYALSVSVAQIRKPMFGGSFTVELELGWSLVRTADRQVVLRKLITSSGTATMGDAFVGMTRLRIAVERSAQDNIRQGLAALADLPL